MDGTTRMWCLFCTKAIGVEIAIITIITTTSSIAITTNTITTALKPSDERLYSVRNIPINSVLLHFLERPRLQPILEGTENTCMSGHICFKQEASRHASARSFRPSTVHIQNKFVPPLVFFTLTSSRRPLLHLAPLLPSRFSMMTASRMDLSLQITQSLPPETRTPIEKGDIAIVEKGRIC